jgi:hypothetical protein
VGDEYPDVQTIKAPTIVESMVNSCAGLIK